LTLVALAGFLVLANFEAVAQLTTADITGTVHDSTGAVVPNANVTLQHLETHQNLNSKSNSVGSFVFTLLPPGHYSVKVEAQGFKSVTIPNLAVEAGDRARADTTLPLGQSSETVEVTAQTPLLQADNATVSSTITDRSVQDLPLNGRNFVQLVQLVPGANEGPGNGLTSGGRPDDRRPTNGFSVNGFDDILNNEVIDGIDNNERVIGTIGVKTSVDAIQEVTVETNNYAPEIGRTAGGVVNVITKSGTNKFHGTAYEFFRNDIFDARNAFATTGAKPELRQNQFGGSIGGPIIKDRTFFFGDYEGFRLVSGTTQTSTVPTIAQYDDIHSLNGGTPQALVAQGNGTAAYAVDPVALNYLMLFPAPNTNGSGFNYSVNPSKTQFSHTVDARIDHKFNASNNLYGRYTYNNVATNTPAQLPNVVNGIVAGGGKYNFSGPAADKANQFAFNYTHIFSANTLVQLRAAYTRINNASFPLDYGTDADTKFGFGPNMNFSTLTSGLTPISITGFPDLGDGAYVPLQDIDSTFQYDGTVSYHHGNHDMKFGAGLIRRQARNIQSAFPFGQYNFGLSTDANSTQILASTLVGAFTSPGPARNVNLYVPDYRTWEPSFFVQDTWKVTHGLTLVYGLRYDVFTPFTEAHNHISNFDYNAAVAGASPAAALQVANVNGVSSTAGIKTDYSNVAPRVGFSAVIAPGTVLRGGFGLSFFPGNYTSNADLKNAPFTSVYAPGCEAHVAYLIQTGLGQPTNQPDCAVTAGSQAYATFAAGLPLPAPQTINSSSLSFVAEDPKFRAGIAEQFNLLIEKAFGPNVLTIGYVGVLGRHLPETINDINEPALNALNVRPLAGVLPGLNGVGWLVSGGVSSYNGLQTSFQRRYNKGLTLNFNYTYAHALSDITGLSEEGQEGWGNADPFNIRKYEYGNADNDIRHRLAGTVTYELPFGRNLKGSRGMLLGGWQTNMLMAWQSGKPFTVVNSGSGPDASGTGAISNRAHGSAINGGVDRPNMIPIPSGPIPAGTYVAFGHAFQPQALGTVGSESRNALYGPDFRHVDLSFFKDFPVRETLKVQFRTEIFNISNTPNYFVNNNVNSSPPTLVGNSSFGKVQAVDPNYSPREFQFVLKVLF
jgi:hypothetical protein